ncbi:MAG: hypothetical protein L6Q81_11540 [Bacteroidia bacterium]|nr:hypothetical protein [Bacteroidia bacterium]
MNNSYAFKMNILQQIIASMNKEEVRHLKLFMSRTNATSDRKDIELFDYIRQRPEDYDETKIQAKLYGTADKNALYRLKNRLLEDIGKSLTLQYSDESDFNHISVALQLARHFIGNSQFQLALHFLGKAEKKAVAAENHELLELIYSEYIRYSQETLGVNPSEYIRKRRDNREQLNDIQEIDDILAEVVYKVRTTQNFTGQDYRIIENLRKRVALLSKKNTSIKSAQLRFKIYHSLSRILLQKHDYKSLEKYLVDTLAEFSRDKLFTRNTHDTRLQMLTYLANAQFKNNRSSASLDTAEELKKAMSEFGGLLHDKYLFFYYNILVINHSVNNRDKAIEVLNEIKENPVITRQPHYHVFIYLNLTVLYFDNRNYKSALRSLVRLTMEDGFQNLDVYLRMKIAIAELIIRYELKDEEFLSKRIDQVRKEFSEPLKTKEGKRHAEMLSLLDDFADAESILRNKPLQKKIAAFIEKMPNPVGDLINYNNWLSGKQN